MKGEKGFTILEMMFAIIIMAILASIAVPNIISWRTDSALSGDARIVKADFERARSMAIKDHTDVTIEFTGAKTYTIDDHESDLITRTLTGTSISGTTLTDDKTTFDSRGRANNTGNVTLTNGSRNAKITVSMIGSVRIN